MRSSKAIVNIPDGNVQWIVFIVARSNRDRCFITAQNDRDKCRPHCALILGYNILLA